MEVEFPDRSYTSFASPVAEYPLVVDFPDRSSTSFASRFVEYPLAIIVEEESITPLGKQEPLIVDFPGSSSDSSSSSLCDSSAPNTPCVSFAGSTQVKFVENLAIHHKQNLYLTESDIKAFMLEKNKHIKMIRVLQRFSGKKSNSTLAKRAKRRIDKANTTPMGLEYYVDTTTSMAEIVSLRDEHCNAVLDEQWRQHRKGGVRDPDAIANVSREASEWARERAHVIGTLHADSDGESVLQAGQQMEVEGRPSRPTPPSA